MVRGSEPDSQYTACWIINSWRPIAVPMPFSSGFSGEPWRAKTKKNLRLNRLYEIDKAKISVFLAHYLQIIDNEEAYNYYFSVNFLCVCVCVSVCLYMYIASSVSLNFSFSMWSGHVDTAPGAARCQPHFEKYEIPENIYIIHNLITCHFQV